MCNARPCWTKKLLVMTDLKAQFLRIPSVHLAGGGHPASGAQGTVSTSYLHSSDLSFLEETALWGQVWDLESLLRKGGGLQKSPSKGSWPKGLSRGWTVSSWACLSSEAPLHTMWDILQSP